MQNIEADVVQSRPSDAPEGKPTTLSFVVLACALSSVWQRADYAFPFCLKLNIYERVQIHQK